MRLQAHQLGKRYASVDAVADVDLSVGPGEFVVVLGRSGSGKSSLLSMLGGLSRPSCGRVTLDDTDLWALSGNARAAFRNRHIGFVFQFSGLVPTLRAVDNVALPALLGGDEAGSVRDRAALLLARVGLGDRPGAYPSELSGGEQRRVALARALIRAPALLMVDEPTADLDEETEADIMALLLEECRGRGASLVMVTHSSELARGADHVLRIRNGRAEIEAAPAAVPLTRAPRDPIAVPQAVPLLAPVSPLSGRLAWLVLVVCALLWGLDFSVGHHQRAALDARQQARQALERGAFYHLEAQLDAIDPPRDGIYRVRIRLDHPYPEEPLFVLGPSVRAFVQVGYTWTEVPMTAAVPPTVQAIEGRRTYDFDMRPEVKDFEEVMPGYYHVRIINDMLVSARRDPKNDVVARQDNYYVYLEPPDADEADLRRRNGFHDKVPLWIPMPPH